MQKTRQFLVLIEQDEDGVYVASVPALKGCHTQASSPEELLPRIREAIELCLEVEGIEEPPMRFVGLQQVEVAL
jgi:predicted RNase H-like HicB family nuclease